MSCLAAELEAAVAWWDAEHLPRPRVALVAGSGLSIGLEPVLKAASSMQDFLPFDARAIKGHSLSYELVGEEPNCVVYLRGRLHAYQGFTAGQVVFAVRLAGLLGAHTLIVSNASGGIYKGARPGDLAVIRDHINLTGLNPLRGALPSEWGPQFPDLMDAYGSDLRAVAAETARTLGIVTREAVYVGVLGPSYETPAEIRAFKTMGADLVGMSTVLEVIAASQLGMRCLGLSLVTNPAAGTASEPLLDHEDVLDVGRSSAELVRRWVTALLQRPEVLCSDR